MAKRCGVPSDRSPCTVRPDRPATRTAGFDLMPGPPRLLPSEPMRRALSGHCHYRLAHAYAVRFKRTVNAGEYAIKRVYQIDGVTLKTADRLACLMGTHPALIYGEAWLDARPVRTERGRTVNR